MSMSDRNNMYHYPDPQQQNIPGQIPGMDTFTQHSGSIPMSEPTGSVDESMISMASTTLVNDPMLDMDMDDSSLADFLRDIMMPPSPNQMLDEAVIEFIPQNYSSRDVLNFGFDSSLDFNDMDYGWMSSQNNNISTLNFHAVPDHVDPPLDNGQQTPGVRNSIGLGAEAFQKSLWNWSPTQRDHVFNDTTALSLPYKDIESLEGRVESDILEYQLDQSSRDGILAMVLATHNRNVEHGMSRVVTSFPSAQLLNSLIHLFFRAESLKTDSWIHIPTFRPQSNRPEFNGIVVAAGAVLSSVPTVRKLGYGIQESVRLALPNLFEHDNSRTRELQILQAYALEIGIGLWSGNKRKMEIAESHAQPLITMLRRSGRFRRMRVPPLKPEVDDNEKTLEAKWRAWIEAESWKRLAFHTLLHDAQASISLLVRPLVSYAEVSLELPCSSALWRAKSPQAWREVYLQQPSTSSRLPSLVNCVHDLTPILKAQEMIDLQHSTSIVLHAIWSLISEYRQLEFVLKLQSPDRHWNGALISTSWYQELCQLGDHFRISVSEWPGGMRPEQNMIQELFMMNLHVSFEELQLFAGKEGTEEAQRVYPLLKLWFETRKSRQAVWHAGQVVRAALCFPSNQLRDFYSVALYHASLALWVYGMISLASSRSRQRRGAPVDPPAENDIVYLDSVETAESRRFIAIGRGVPVIQELSPALPLQPKNQEQDKPGFVRLDNPKAVMETVIYILTRDCTGGKDAFSPLVENLGQLVRDLGNAARIVGR
ncbi:hypothetical protein BP6252_00574 [Coleophoma cylindrospora]|uniref:Xylanolytic transcriptional activator regulatory domain-containing protein n=1 Tax=Coleophoma cylindrospora TaxID=1849047 RepID=A0A3D8SQH6_9HELO|nr:hypothetical protein BP6252_00574 [Coleophoma cylindrospora]